MDVMRITGFEFFRTVFHKDNQIDGTHIPETEFVSSDVFDPVVLPHNEISYIRFLLYHEIKMKALLVIYGDIVLLEQGFQVGDFLFRGSDFCV